VRELSRGQTAVCIPVFGALELFEECLASVVEHTDASVPVLVADDATPGGGVDDVIARVAGSRDVEYVRADSNRGFVENVNAALRLLAPADVVVLNSDCVVTPGWLEGLRAAADTDTRIATVTALADRATIASVPEAAGADPVGAAERVRAASLRLRPRLPTAIGHCFLVRRSALELVGELDTAFSPGYGEEVDFSQRCLLAGLVHVLADDVFVEHRGAGSFSERAETLRADHERLVESRYPWYPGAVRRAGEGAVADAVGAARRSLRPLTVTVDGSALGPQTMGTQVTTLALTRALVEHGDGVRVRVALASDPDPATRAVFESIGVETVRVDEPGERSDIVHRPAQAVSPVNLQWLDRLGERIVITQQDLIAYANPGYFRSFEEWDEHRALARQSLAFADAAVFISGHVRDEALAEELVDADRAVVVPQGVDHGVAPVPARPDGVPGGEFLLLLGADFRHKNRVFALRMFRAMRSRGFGGALVLAGPQVELGSSRALEDGLEVADGVVRLGEVSEAEKAWLYANAALALYPTVSEGFGLVPFEAAAAGTACMFAPVSSLVEVLDPATAILVPWDAEASADRAMALLSDETERTRLVDAVLERGQRYTWAGTATALVGVYRDVLRRPAQPARSIYFGAGLSDVAMSLVGPGALLPPDVQRALLGIAARPALRGPTFAALRASYRALRRARRGGDSG
jgi:GT2 family glycosyltransferase/glycosyltransferase involved in cell wall biosynthesis